MNVRVLLAGVALTVVSSVFVVDAGVRRRPLATPDPEIGNDDGGNDRTTSKTIDDDVMRYNFACEGDTLNIACSVWRRIHISAATFGRTSWDDVCRVPGDRRGADEQLPCESTKALQIVMDRCDGLRLCSLSTTSFQASETCSSDVHSYLSVQFRCEPLTAPPRTSRTSSTKTTTTTSGTTSSPTLLTSRLEPRTTSPEVASALHQREFCPSTTARGLRWPDTESGRTARVPCPQIDHRSTGEVGIATWTCGKHPVHWIDSPNLKTCAHSAASDLKSKMKQQSLEHFSHDVMDEVVTQIAGVYQKDTRLYGGDLDAVTDVLSAVVNSIDTQLQNETVAAELAPLVQKVFKTVIDTNDILLTEHNVVTWHDLSHDDQVKSASRILQMVEATTLQFAGTLSVGDRKSYASATTMMLEVGSINDDTSGNLEFPQVDDLQGTPWHRNHPRVHLSEKLVTGLKRIGQLKFAFVMYDNIEGWLNPLAGSETQESMDYSSPPSDAGCPDDSDGASDKSCTPDPIINTNIISVAVSLRHIHSLKLPEPVTFTLAHKKVENVSNASCVFWKFSNSSPGGDWSPDGCTLVDTNSTHTTCACDHLTSFAILMSPTAPQLSDANVLALDILTYIGCIISSICLALAFITFQFCRTLQGDRNTVHKNLVINLLVANVLFIAGVDQVSLPVLCSVIAGFLHYFFLTSFMWMCLEGIQLYVMLVEVFEAERSRVVWYYLSGYGIPALIVGVSAAVYHQGYGTEAYCWLSTEKGFIWAFIAPVIAILMINAAMLGIAISAMYQHTKLAALWRREKSKGDQIRTWIKGAFVLEILLGLTWAFGLAFVNAQTVAFAYIFTIINSLQGMFIFVFHCIMNEKVRSEYQRWIRHATCLPESFRKRFGGARSSLSTLPNQSNSSGGNYLVRLLSSRRRRSSSSTTLSKSNSMSNRKSNLHKEHQTEEPLNPNPVSINNTDSGFDDPMSYLEPPMIRLGESEFQVTENEPSMIEGSIVDTDFAEKITQRDSSTKASPSESVDDPGLQVDIISEEPSQTAHCESDSDCCANQHKRQRSLSSSSGHTAAHRKPQRRGSRPNAVKESSGDRRNSFPSVVEKLSPHADPEHSHFLGKVTSC